MAEVQYRVSFRLDAAAVWDYIGKDAPDRADAVIDDVRATLSMLAQFPLAGRSRSELARGVRSFPVGQYLIYYLPIEGGGIIALRLLHTSRDVEGLF